MGWPPTRAAISDHPPGRGIGAARSVARLSGRPRAARACIPYVSWRRMALVRRDGLTQAATASGPQGHRRRAGILRRPTHERGGLVVAQPRTDRTLALIHISEPTRLGMISYAVFCLKKKKQKN